MSTVPTFMVVGAARSGTTALIEGMRRHPRVFVTHPKEPHYFALHHQEPEFTAPGDASTINRVATPGTDDYLALYPSDASTFDALGEGSVSTLYYHGRSIPEIQRLAPDARLVVILREPVERAKSAYDYLVSKGHEDAPSLMDAVAAEEDRIARGYHHLWHYTAMSRYADAVSAFLQAFGPDQVGIWFYDDLSSDYAATLSSVLRFVGADATASGGAVSDEAAVVNASGTPRWPLVTRLIHTAAANDLSRSVIQRLSTFAFRERVRRVVLRKDVLDPRVRAQLAPLFHDDLAQLRGLLTDRPLPTWLQDPGVLA